MAKYRVKELAKKAGMTQFDLATKSEVSMTVVQRLWQNRAPAGIRYSTLEAIAEALGVHVDDLKASSSDDSGPDPSTFLNRESLVLAVA